MKITIKKIIQLNNIKYKYRIIKLAQLKILTQFHIITQNQNLLDRLGMLHVYHVRDGDYESFMRNCKQWD